MITWIKLEPVPLKEKVFTARIESQVDQTIAQIKRSYIIPTGMEIENGGDGVLIGSDSDNQIHEAALEKIMLDYPTEWDEQAKEPKEPTEETASFEEEAFDYEAEFELTKEYIPTIKLVEFLKIFATHEELFEKKEIKKVDVKKVTENFFDVFEKPNIIPFDRRPKELDQNLGFPPNVTPFDRRPKELDQDLGFAANVISFKPKKVAKLNLKFVDFEEFYGWVLDNSFIISKLKSAFYIAKLKSLAIPTMEFVNSFEDPKFTDSLEKFCIENDTFSYPKPTYLIWTK